MSDWEQIREIARSIRPHLRELVPEQAESLEARISELLNRQEQRQDELLLELLSAHEATREWVLSRLGQGAPSATRAFSGTVGGPAGFELEVYSCPCGDYSWYVTGVGEEIPLCPNHKIALRYVGTK
jgi:hypothetical protein